MSVAEKPDTKRSTMEIRRSASGYVSPGDHLYFPIKDSLNRISGYEKVVFIDYVLIGHNSQELGARFTYYDKVVGKWFKHSMNLDEAMDTCFTLERKPPIFLLKIKNEASVGGIDVDWRFVMHSKDKIGKSIILAKSTDESDDEQRLVFRVASTQSVAIARVQSN